MDENELAIARNIFESACAKALGEGLTIKDLEEIVATTLLLEVDDA